MQSVDRLSLRERLFLLAAVLFVLGGLWEAVLAGAARGSRAGRFGKDHHVEAAAGPDDRGRRELRRPA